MIHISSGNTKIGHTPNFSLRPVIDCGENCRFCKHSCYARCYFLMYPSVTRAWGDNGLAIRNDLGITIPKLLYKIKKRPKRYRKYFRIHVSGDFVTQEYLDGWIYIAEQIKDTRFMAFTKQYHLDYSKLPSNLIIVISTWKGLEDNAPLFLPRNYIENQVVIPEYKRIVTCLGSCENCRACWEADCNTALVFPLKGRGKYASYRTT